MTLIAAWITDDFRIVASDSKSQIKRIDDNFDCQKIYNSNELAIGIYGNLSEGDRNLLKEYLQINLNYDKEKLISDLSLILPARTKGIKEIDFKKNGITHLLIVPKTEEPEILCIKKGYKPLRKTLKDYKDINQKGLPKALFFSEQRIEAGNIDFMHQKNLVSLLVKLEKKKLEGIKLGWAINENSVIDSKLELLIKLFQIVRKDKKLNCNGTIGGVKVYFAYSVNGIDWEKGNYAFERNGKDPDVLFQEGMNILNELLDKTDNE
uniref:hypothetical protein n=1 Tax=uncultured Draconibacterium sp. TaxID=1573823 RepID=UPI003217F540